MTRKPLQQSRGDLETIPDQTIAIPLAGHNDGIRVAIAGNIANTRTLLALADERRALSCEHATMREICHNRCESAL